MSDRIDHAARSDRRMENTLSNYETGEDAGAIVVALAALNDATLALVEQQRIANLIALTQETFAAHEAREALSTFATAKLGEQIGLRPDIAAALGIEAVDHG